MRTIGSVKPDEFEHDLLVRFRALDPDAWETVYRRSYARLSDYARRRLPASHDPADAVNECMARAVDRIEDLQDRGVRVEAWLYGILRLVVLEQARRLGRQERERPGGSAPGPAQASPEFGPLEQVLHHERLGSVRGAFEQLSPEDQEVLWLRLVAELSVAEVAEIVGRRAGAVRQAHSRALTRLKKLMEEVER